MPGIDPFASITGAILSLLLRDGDLFVRLGLNMFRGVAVVLLAWFGIRAALASAEGGSGLPLGRFVTLVLTIAFGFAMITYYRAPIPGLGRSFTQLLTDEPIYLARQLEITQVQQLSDRLNQVYLSLEQPTVFNVSAFVGYLIVALAVTAARVALLAVIAFGLIATGVAVLVGPVFIPFFLVPQMEWMFWGWLRSLLQYAFYQVIAQAFVFVGGHVPDELPGRVSAALHRRSHPRRRLPSRVPAPGLHVWPAEGPVAHELALLRPGGGDRPAASEVAADVD